jgi:hypothetical protein
MLPNVSTLGFKKQRSLFEDVLLKSDCSKGYVPSQSKIGARLGTAPAEVLRCSKAVVLLPPCASASVIENAIALTRRVVV